MIGIADRTFDPSFKELQHSGASTGTNSKGIFRFGISTSVVVDGVHTPALPGTNPTDIVWFDEATGGFTVITKPVGTIDYGREDVTTSGNFKQTQAGQITMTKTFGIKADKNSKLIQMLMNVEMSDGMNGYDGALLKAYANGGYHCEMGTEWSDTGLRVTQLNLNCKIGAQDSAFSDYASDGEISFELLVEYSPYYILDGDYKAGLGLQDNGLSCVESTTVTESGTTPGEITINPVLTITDTNSILGTTPEYTWYAFNTAKSVKCIASGHVVAPGTVTDAFIIADGGSAGDVFKINYFYNKDQLLVAAASQDVTVTLAP